jgi:hypothetical protein
MRPCRELLPAESITAKTPDPREKVPLPGIGIAANQPEKRADPPIAERSG